MGPGPASGRFDFCFVFTSRKGLRCVPRAKLSALTRSDHLGRGRRGGQESNALPQATERGPWDCSPQPPGGSASPRPPDPPPGESRERVLGLERRKAGPGASQRPAPPEIAVARPAGLRDAARLQEPAVHSPRQTRADGAEGPRPRDPGCPGSQRAPVPARRGVDVQRARRPGGGRAEAQPCGRYCPGARSAATASENRNVKVTVAPT